MSLALFLLTGQNLFGCVAAVVMLMACRFLCPADQIARLVVAALVMLMTLCLIHYAGECGLCLIAAVTVLMAFALFLPAGENIFIAAVTVLMLFNTAFRVARHGNTGLGQTPDHRPDHQDHQKHHGRTHSLSLLLLPLQFIQIISYKLLHLLTFPKYKPLILTPCYTSRSAHTAQGPHPEHHSADDLVTLHTSKRLRPAVY